MCVLSIGLNAISQLQSLFLMEPLCKLISQSIIYPTPTICSPCFLWKPLCKFTTSPGKQAGTGVAVLVFYGTLMQADPWPPLLAEVTVL